MMVVLAMVGLVTYILLVRFSCDTRERGDWRFVSTPTHEFASNKRKPRSTPKGPNSASLRDPSVGSPSISEPNRELAR